MTKVLLVGASGRMGTEISAEILKQGLVCHTAISSSRLASGYIKNFKTIQEIDISDVDVAIDFSNHKVWDDVLSSCVKYKVPLVSGVTGVSADQIQKLDATSKDIPIFYSANMSVGIATVRAALKSFSALKNFDFQIEEFHHNKKQDSPSGTAILLQNSLQSVVSNVVPQPLAARMGGIFGVHKVHAVSDSEWITIEHQALNRRVFAEGAVMAAIWLVKQKPGLYDMDDLLGFKKVN